MAFHLIATFRSAPGQEQRLADELTAMVEPTSAEPGCLDYRALTVPGRPDTVVMIEEWRDLAALESHLDTDHFKRIAALFGELLAELPDVTELNRTDDSQFARLELAL